MKLTKKIKMKVILQGLIRSVG